MYGLMKAHTCSKHRDNTAPYRLHYCGTCKTMGRLYGQKARMLLNHDAVFLAELLTALTPDTVPAENWDQSYLSYNCFALPENSEQMPLPLQIAASATLLMTEFKLADQIEDSAKGGWGFAQKLFSPAFFNAAALLESHGFPLKSIREWYAEQSARETAVSSGSIAGTPDTILASVAEPTATVTAFVFQHGAATVGGAANIQQTMQELGFAFGSLIYTLDAWDDFEKDAQRNDFNALRYAFGTDGKILPDVAHDTTVVLLQKYQAQVERALRTLPLPVGYAQKFILRLNQNLARRLGLAQTAAACTSVAEAENQPLRERLTAARVLARSLARTPDTADLQVVAHLSKPFRFLTVFGVALLFPYHAQKATSFRECRDIALNLMFIGDALQQFRPRRVALAGASSSTLGSLSMEQGPVHSSGGATRSSAPRKRGRNTRSGPGCCDGFCEGCACGCCESCACDCSQIACCECTQCCAEGGGCAEAGCCCADGCCADASCCGCSS